MIEKNTRVYQRYDVTNDNIVLSRTNDKAVESAEDELKRLEAIPSGKRTKEEKMRYFQLKAFFEGLKG